MIRVVVYLVLVGVLALGVAWLADRPGDVTVIWQGLRIETSLMVTAVAILLLIALVLALWSILRAILRTPDMLSMFVRSRRGARGYNAISRGLIAIGSGDARAARKFADEASRIAPGEPLTLLLAAQAAQLAGERAAAERSFRIMAGREDTKLLGLHGLFTEARRRNDLHAARLFAEEAAATAPALGWAGHAVLEFRSAAGDWLAALESLDRNLQGGLIGKPEWRRQRAVLLTARALATEDDDRDTAKASALEAAKLAPDLVPAAVLAGRFLGEAGDLRKASRTIEAAWRKHPHPDLADAYAHLRFGDSARDRLKRVQTLAQKAPGHLESALALARAALDAQEFGAARAALAPLLSALTPRVAMLMAEIERTEHGDEGRAREWMTRALNAAQDPAWTADGVVSDRWLPVSPVTGRLDAFQWKAPLAELGQPARVIPFEDAVTAHAPLDPVLPTPPRPAPPPVPAEAAPTAPAPAVARPPESDPDARQRRRRPSRPAEQVIPILRAPDDPGPEADAQPDDAVTADPLSPGSRRVRGL